MRKDLSASGPPGLIHNRNQVYPKEEVKLEVIMESFKCGLMTIIWIYLNYSLEQKKAGYELPAFFKLKTVNYGNVTPRYCPGLRTVIFVPYVLLMALMNSLAANAFPFGVR